MLRIFITGEVYLPPLPNRLGKDTIFPFSVNTYPELAGVGVVECCLKLETNLLNTVFKAPKFFLQSFPLWFYYSLLTFRLICYHLYFFWWGGGFLPHPALFFFFFFFTHSRFHSL